MSGAVHHGPCLSQGGSCCRLACNVACVLALHKVATGCDPEPGGEPECSTLSFISFMCNASKADPTAGTRWSSVALPLVPPPQLHPYPPQFLRLGFSGYRKIMRNLQLITKRLALAIQKMGHFELLSKDVGVPLVAFRLTKLEGRDGKRHSRRGLFLAGTLNPYLEGSLGALVQLSSCAVNGSNH